MRIFGLIKGWYGMNLDSFNVGLAELVFYF